MKKISIIVPVYNVEDYLKRCIDSLISQTYSNIEIILVDDGATDNSGKICDEYEEKDERIKVIHKKNGGLSDARNVGLDKSMGDYVCFVDSDDYIEKDMIENLYNIIEKDNSDISCCAKVLEYSNKTIERNNRSMFCIDNISGLGKMFTFDDIDTSACDKIFKKELFHNVKFPLGKYYEDMGTIYKIFEKAKKISHTPKIGYHYCIRDNSITKEKFSAKQFQLLYFAEEIKDEMSKKYPEIKEQIYSFYYLQLIDILVKLKKASNFNEHKTEYKKIKKFYNKNIFNIIKNRYIQFYKKIMAILIYLKFYRIVILLKNN